ncbi:hypothetical protein B0T14DRAFT_337083 [Immersiella caudata]|uniref:Uncharacterized protein n=1 Tax=Immersiella caudata TaxID=314043 RepID=A0AA39WC55_9PEZI|nr:hypothetical protein B0T14DRAFT_337083 [Immersiella caudata]
MPQGMCPRKDGRNFVSQQVRLWQGSHQLGNVGPSWSYPCLNDYTLLVLSALLDLVCMRSFPYCYVPAKHRISPGCEGRMVLTALSGWHRCPKWRQFSGIVIASEHESQPKVSDRTRSVTQSVTPQIAWKAGRAGSIACSPSNISDASVCNGYEVLSGLLSSQRGEGTEVGVVVEMTSLEIGAACAKSGRRFLEACSHMPSSRTGRRGTLRHEPPPNIPSCADWESCSN